MSLGNRLKAVRKHFNLTQTVFASKLNITKVTIINYEKGNRYPDSKLLNLIQKLFKINLHWLLTGEGEMFITDREAESTDDIHIMHIAADIAAGEPAEVTAERLETLTIGHTLIHNVNDYFCFQVNGQSMEPYIEHQDLVIIKKDSNWKDKENTVCAVRVDGEITLKRIIHGDKHKLLVLISDNKGYPPIIVDPKHSDVLLIGSLYLVVRRVE
ncbi:MAG: helix-turn-helix domain-containing protein [Candidatus Cloacimonetes bacterium]|nr:helix-turn-helix domain-containing protein [Candidatus Cloacimonadota bacterium]